MFVLIWKTEVCITTSHFLLCSTQKYQEFEYMNYGYYHGYFPDIFEYSQS